MRPDHETTDLPSAAMFEADRTPYYDERPSLGDLVGPTVEHAEGPLVDAFLAHFRPMRCAHGLCRTSLNDRAWVECPHGLKFCEACAWEEACSECAA